MGLPPLSGDPDPAGGDCVACGRCCHHGPRTVHLTEPDEARMGEELLLRWTEVHERSGYRFVRNTGERCACLDESEPGRFPCVVYERRPEDCRVFRAASDGCREARRLGRMGSPIG